MNEKELREGPIDPALPCKSGEPLALPEGLIGATIIAIGMMGDGQGIEGGGLAIDFRPANSVDTVRLAMAFNELGNVGPILLENHRGLVQIGIFSIRKIASQSGFVFLQSVYAAPRS